MSKNKFPYEISEIDTTCKSPSNLVSIESPVSSCPVCNAKLSPEFSLVPISKSKCARVEGSYCAQRDRLYTRHNAYLENMLKYNQFTKEFTLNGEQISAPVKPKKPKKPKKSPPIKQGSKPSYSIFDQLNATVGAVLMLKIDYYNGNTEFVSIVNKEKYASPERKIYCYTAYEAREFLSAAFAPTRLHRGKLHGLEYRISAMPIYPDKRRSADTSTIILRDLYIKSGGGYSRSLTNDEREIIDLLLYSPFTDRYELLRVTYDAVTERYFCDISLYRGFVHNFGNPKLIPHFELSAKGSFGYDNLNDVSKLRSYGYSVNERELLPRGSRRELLAELMDLELMSACEISRFLDFLIRTHPHHPSACAKWHDDKEFVEHYILNVNRFLIAK